MCNTRRPATCSKRAAIPLRSFSRQHRVKQQFSFDLYIESYISIVGALRFILKIGHPRYSRRYSRRTCIIPKSLRWQTILLFQAFDLPPSRNRRTLFPSLPVRYQYMSDVCGLHDDTAVRDAADTAIKAAAITIKAFGLAWRRPTRLDDRACSGARKDKINGTGSGFGTHGVGGL